MEKFCKIKRVIREIHSFEKELKESSTLTLNEALVLCTLKESGCSAGYIANELGLSPARMSKVLSVIEKRGLIVRSFDTQDKRIMHFEISDEGRTLIEQVKKMDIVVPNFSVS
ncbi:MAG: MarR family transcriptional regulator [Spirochaetes bacterium]|nr:MarR family transcriptional regulator [Spirochaetota bacterium]